MVARRIDARHRQPRRQTALWSWDGENLTHVATVDGHEGDRPPEGYLRSLAWSPDGTKLVTVGFDGTIRIWDAASRSQERVITGHDDDYIRSVSFSPDGRMFVTAGNDGTVRVWDAQTGAPIRTLEGHTGRASRLYSRLTAS